VPGPDRIDPEATYAMGPVRRRKGVALGTIAKAIKAGVLPATKDGGRWAIRGADLLAWTPLRRPPPPGMLTVPEVARLAGVTTSTLWRDIRRGALPAAWAGGRWLIDPKDLAAWRRAKAPVGGPDRPAARYRMAEAARILGVSRQAVHQAVREGRLKAVATADGTRIRGADLLEW
jgi:excisionase family DNA binding protein